MSIVVNALQVLDGHSNSGLAKEIGEYLGIILSKCEIKRFQDGEIWAKINQSVRNADVFVVQPTCKPVTENLMILLILIDALRRASADRITAVVPYFGFSRQEKKTTGREPITCKLVANLLVEAGADRILTMDLHTPAIQGFFDIPVDHASALPLLANYFKEFNREELVIVSPDAGGVERVRSFAQRLKCPIAIIDKRRPAHNQSEVMHIVGEVEGKTAIIVDDIVDTGGSLVKAAEAVKAFGALRVFGCCSHSVFSFDAVERIEKSCIEKFITTNSIPLDETQKCDKIVQISIAPMLAELIKRINRGISVSELFV